MEVQGVLGTTHGVAYSAALILFDMSAKRILVSLPGVIVPGVLEKTFLSLAHIFLTSDAGNL